MSRPLRVFTFLAIVVLAVIRPAQASFHLWRIEQVYTNPSGTVQFIQLGNISDDEDQMQGRVLVAGTNSFTFPQNLSTTATANHHLLLATPGYFALAGVPPADFNLGTNNFFHTTGDVLHYAGVNDVTLSPIMLPADGVRAALVDRSGSVTGSAVNAPANFAGTSNTIPRWENQDNRFDVSGGDGVTVLDVLQVINEINAHGVHTLATPTAGNSPPPYVDVNGDNMVQPLDLLQVINQLQSQSLAKPAAAQALTVPLFSTAVPEPSTATLTACAVAMLAIVAVARTRRRHLSAGKTVAPDC